MSKFAEWLLALVKDGFKAVWDFLTDIVISILDAVLSAVVTLIGAIPVPSFASGGLNAVLSAIPGDVWYFAGHFKLPECFAILGTAMAFRLARKLATLGQW